MIIYRKIDAGVNNSFPNGEDVVTAALPQCLLTPLKENVSGAHASTESLDIPKPGLLGSLDILEWIFSKFLIFRDKDSPSHWTELQNFKFFPRPIREL
ncbi:hypothetical protein JTB14_019009 [Gonioctena quinquepunctata]|nr:hypothetical protein JTB14_019009 [Gonioctena quinquepunctata]